MYQKTLSYYVAMLYRSFSAFTGERLQAVGLNFGLVFFIVYIGKNCTAIKTSNIQYYFGFGHAGKYLRKATAQFQ